MQTKSIFLRSHSALCSYSVQAPDALSSPCVWINCKGDVGGKHPALLRTSETPGSATYLMLTCDLLQNLVYLLLFQGLCRYGNYARTTKSLVKSNFFQSNFQKSCTGNISHWPFVHLFLTAVSVLTWSIGQALSGL